jgi:hypothetical protein
MSLPDSWVSKIFDRMAVTYGVKWTRMWEGLDINAIRASWADELEGFKTWPEALHYGLRYLPTENPPNALQFRDLCRKAPKADPVPQLPSPPADPRKAAEAKQKAAQLAANRNGSRDWAYALQARELSGERLTKAQRDMWRSAIHVPIDEEGSE